MPRIAAALGALLLMVFSIGLNISRYPMVWEMVGPATHLPQSEVAAESEPSPQPEAEAESTPARESIPLAITSAADTAATSSDSYPEYEYQSSSSSAYTEPEPADVTEDAPGYHEQPLMTYAPPDPPADTFTSSNSDRPLVRVVRREVASQVRRLPPVELSDAVQLSADEMRTYPTTGIE